MNPRLRSAVELTGRFLRWWYAELRSCASDLPGLLLPRWRRALILHVDARKILWIDRRPGVSDQLHEIARPHWKAALPDALPESILGAFEPGRRAVLQVAANQAFICRLRLPLAALPHLKTAISLHLGRMMPLDPALLLVDFAITGADPKTGTLNVDLAALKRADVEPMVSRIRGWGFRISAIQLSDGPESLPRFRFIDIEKHHGVGAMGRTNRILVGTAATLGLACVGVTATETYRAQQALDLAAERTTATASVALARRQQLLTQLEPLAALSRLESDPTAAALLTDITALVPLDTWLTTLEFKDHHLHMVGLSPDSAALVKQLSNSSLLTDVELRSSMSAGIGTRKDRFEITAEAKGAPP
jgi:general secretion pathway protein L